MITSEIANTVIAKAKNEKRECDKSSHQFQPSYNQPLGYHVLTVFDSVVALEHQLPYSDELEKCNDQIRCLEIIMSTAV